MPVQGDIRAKNVTQLLPGVQLTPQRGSRYLAVRICNKDAQTYIHRSTGKEAIPEATAYVMEHLQELFTLKPTERKRTKESLVRLISKHLELQEQRLKAGKIADSTLLVYQKNGRYFIEWLHPNKFKKVSDIKRTSLRGYARDRVNIDGMSPSTVNLEIVYFRMFWSWLQSEEILDRPLDMPKLRQAVENRTGGEPFERGYLKKINQSIKDWIDDKSPSNFGKRSISKYNRLVF